MHDPNTVAFDLKLGGRHLVTIWHVDPQKGGDEDSCGWWLPHLDATEVALADALIDDEYDNLRRWFPETDELYDMKRKLRRIFRLHKRLGRRWWREPRWHIWHWQLQVHPIQKFKRWAFSRCEICGGRFGRYDGVLGLEWDGKGPSWFRNTERIAHEDCYTARRLGCLLPAE